MTWHAQPIEPLQPGSPDWLRHMSASKVAAVLGLSPWESRYSMWHLMNGTITRPSEPTDVQARGHYLEPAIRDWFEDQHPDWEVRGVGASWQHPLHAAYTCGPDGLIYDGSFDPVAGLECKSDAGDTWLWGQPDRVPPYYLAQADWSMYVTGLDEWRFAALLGPGLQFSEYRVTRDWIREQHMVTEVAEFMASLALGVEPDRDTHDATYQAVRDLHPDIEDRDVDLDPDVARVWCEARHLLKAAERAEMAARIEVAAHMGMARRARFDGQTVATRQAKAGRVGVVAGRNLPTFTDKEVAA